MVLLSFFFFLLISFSHFYHFYRSKFRLTMLEKPAFTPVMPVYNPQTGPISLPRVAGNFSADNTWYRAEVLEIIPATASQPVLYRLRYIDYGNVLHFFLIPIVFFFIP